ncbi:MAG TPA: hypothetical protein VHP33_36965 [Polyangiaceae bacterium]|nr:hypothetical protein [Polyangiaceae bacterium]
MKSLLPLPHLVFGLAAFSLTGLGMGCSSDSPDATNGSAGTSSGGSQSATAGSTSAGSGTAGSASGATDLRGSVVVTLNDAVGDGADYSSLIGRFFSGPTPDPFPLKHDTTDGDCELKVPLLPFCNEPCSPDVCTGDDQCTPYPAPVAVGDIAVNGLGDALSLAPATTMIVYQSPSLAYPPCEAGAKVTASADGFALEAECIAPLEVTGPEPLPVKTGEVVHVTWKPAASGAKSRIRIGLDISHHGGKKGQIDCEVPDTGSFDIPAPLVTKLIGLGLAGFPTINVNRVSLGVDAKNAEVSLLLSSSVTRPVDTGVKSCLDDAECDDGQTCSQAGICE